MAYVAKQGDIVWISLNPQSGHEQSGRRPAVVVSNNAFNDFTKTSAMLCPITNTNRNSPIQVKLDERTSTTGVVMCDQNKTLDICVRNAEFIEKLPDDILAEVVDIIQGFIEIE